MNLDHVARKLSPSLDPNAVMRRHASSLMQRRLLSFSPGTVFSTVLEAKEFGEQLPRRVANRITLGLVLAALIVGAAMMMRIESRFTLLGYPGFPTLLFLVAGSLGLWLVFNIVAHDRVVKRK